ncbi:hypothetical protein [Natronosalvus vescus]|uniref:hypothetical protein n=1 Tax=Natronosalvus vescus TaxID=2953881 RepID=UPI00209030B6|nr:hypothetical protein [Natronosalvus vescus]
MAREQADSDRETSVDPDSGRVEQSTKHTLKRRSYLTLAGAVIGGGAIAGSASASEDYDVITLSRNERRVVRVGDNETFENVIFDQTASGAAAVLVAHGTNWTVRNVGWRGPISGENRAFTCSDRGGNTSVAENLYIGDGVVRDSASDRYDPSLGIWVSPKHSGHIDFRNIYIEGALDNAFYCSAPGYTGAGGTVHIDNCYTKDNDISHYRISSSGDKVTNCVAVNTSGYNGRGVWAWGPGPVELENCHLDAGSRNYAIVAGSGNSGGCDIDCTDVQYNTDFNGGIRDGYGSTVSFNGNSGTNPRDFVPEGVPTSPEEAAAGISSGSGSLEPSEPEGDVLRMEGAGSYSFETDGTVEPSSALSRYLTEGEAHGDDWADWYLTGSWTEWHVTGDFTTFEVDTYEDLDLDLTFYLNGDEVEPAELGVSGLEKRHDDDSSESILRMEGAGDYAFETDGSVEPSPELAQYLTEGESYGDDWADWYLTGSWTEWHVTGDFTSFQVSENEDGNLDLTFYLDGEAIDPEELGVTGLEDGGSSESILRMEGAGDYAFETDGSVEPSPELAQYLTEGESYGDDWADWYLTGSWTEWHVTGDFTTFQVAANEDGNLDLTFYLDGEATDPEELGVSGLENDGTGADSSDSILRMEGSADYYLETDGSVEPDPNLAQYVTEGEAYGENWADWYLTDSWTQWKVCGEFTAFELSDVDGQAPDVTVTLDGEEVDPSSL